MADKQLQELLQRVQRELTCPVCKREFALEELKVRGVFEKQYLIQTGCHQGHPATLVLYVAPQNAPSKSGQHMTADDVIDLHTQLKGFNGDFRSIFKRNE